MITSQELLLLLFLLCPSSHNDVPPAPQRNVSMNAVALVGSVQYTCPVVPLCIVDASLSHYVGNWLFLCFKIIKCGSFNLALIVRQA